MSEVPVVYNVPPEKQQRANVVIDRGQLTAPGYSVSNRGCFAGGDDELVVALSSNNHNLFIWSVPEGRGDRNIGQSLLSLSGHQHAVINVRYSKVTSRLASGDDGGIIKLWTPSSTVR